VNQPPAADPRPPATQHPAPSTQHLALWGGIECTVNRVGDAWFDQYAHGGHDDRIEDLDRIAALGIRTLRYGLLWERIAPNGTARADWRWADERLGRLRGLGVRPIAGLVHHGSGPADTNLLDPTFPEKLAVYARAVAERFPWLDAWTPVNEPFTTARFSALYGHWYPHLRDERACMTALLHQCKATVLAMAQVRAVNPAAVLIQTEDLGKTHGTERTQLQVEFENERRWLTFDLLLGKVVPGHRMWEHLAWLGVPERDLAFFAEHPCPPAVLGVNTYLTSERFLDHRLEHYPERLHGGNGWLGYADIEAIRVRRDGVAGPEALLREAWERYRLPLAVTEAHLGCSREDQVRWLAEVWAAALAAREAGADVRAVTVWSLLGAHDWHCLLTRRDGHYEPGAFDLRGPSPRPTAVARLAAGLARGDSPDHPLLADPGWWRRPERLLYPPWPATDATEERDPTDQPAVPPAARRFRIAQQPLLVIGADDAFGRAVVASSRARGIPVVALDGAAGGVAGERAADAGALAVALAEHRPWAVIDARLRREPTDRALAPGIDIAAGVDLAAACATRGLPLLALSSALVFDGGKGTPYLESDPVAPAEPVGARHADLEAAVAAAHPGGLVVRTGAPFSATGGDPALAAALAALAAGADVAADDDAPHSVAWLPDLAHAALDLLIDGETGLWHLAHPEPVTRAALLRDLAERLGHDPRKVVPLFPARRNGVALPAPTPAGGTLGSERGLLLPGVDAALARLAAA
jgi:dTDP-4-dehydrorhamnose reductase